MYSKLLQENAHTSYNKQHSRNLISLLVADVSIDAPKPDSYSQYFSRKLACLTYSTGTKSCSSAEDAYCVVHKGTMANRQGWQM